VLLYSVASAELEVVLIEAFETGVGIGTLLLTAARAEAVLRRCRRLWLVTTNDNRPAIEFYRRRGLRIAAVRRGAMAESRRLKPSIPLLGVGGVPIEDEIEMEIAIG
jgi:GNAT superfamily N-acetyltransferase